MPFTSSRVIGLLPRLNRAKLVPTRNSLPGKGLPARI